MTKKNHSIADDHSSKIWERTNIKYIKCRFQLLRIYQIYQMMISPPSRPRSPSSDTWGRGTKANSQQWSPGCNLIGVIYYIKCIIYHILFDRGTKANSQQLSPGCVLIGVIYYIKCIIYYISFNSGTKAKSQQWSLDCKLILIRFKWNNRTEIKDEHKRKIEKKNTYILGKEKLRKQN